LLAGLRKNYSTEKRSVSVTLVNCHKGVCSENSVSESGPSGEAYDAPPSHKPVGWGDETPHSQPVDASAHSVPRFNKSSPNVSGYGPVTIRSINSSFKWLERCS